MNTLEIKINREGVKYLRKLKDIKPLGDVLTRIYLSKLNSRDGLAEIDLLREVLFEFNNKYDYRLSLFTSPEITILNNTSSLEFLSVISS